MNKIRLLIWIMSVAGIAALHGQPAPGATSPATNTTAVPEGAPVAAPVPGAESTSPPAVPVESTAPVNGTNGLRLNFRGAPLDAVLEYLSDAAGFIIVKETRVRGTVDVWSNQPLTKEEAVNLLNTVLKKNGYAAIRNDRTLTIVNRDEAKTHDIPVISGNDPDKIPRNDEIVTQIIPVRFV